MGDGDRGGDKVTNIFAFKGGKGRRVGAVPVGGAMTAEQKQQLVGQVDAIVAASHAKGKPTNHQAVWAKFQAHFRINTYHALDADKFARGMDYLGMLLGRATRGEL
jgi:ABC-type branched-subunit amino acid transport system substrate-binding protein